MKFKTNSSQNAGVKRRKHPMVNEKIVRGDGCSSYWEVPISFYKKVFIKILREQEKLKVGEVFVIFVLLLCITDRGQANPLFL